MFSGFRAGVGWTSGTMGFDVEHCWFSYCNIILGQYARSKTATKFLDSLPTKGYNRTSKVVPIHNGSG